MLIFSRFYSIFLGFIIRTPPSPEPGSSLYGVGELSGGTFISLFLSNFALEGNKTEICVLMHRLALYPMKYT